MELLLTVRMLQSWKHSAANVTGDAEERTQAKRLLSNQDQLVSALPLLSRDTDFNTLRGYFNDNLERCDGLRGCQRAVYALTYSVFLRQIVVVGNFIDQFVSLRYSRVGTVLGAPSRLVARSSQELQQRELQGQLQKQLLQVCWFGSCCALR
jgi:hypothetical protein